MIGLQDRTACCPESHADDGDKGCDGPLWTRFRTRDRFYVYDTYSNHILDTPKPVWEAFDLVMKVETGSTTLDAAESKAVPAEVMNEGLQLIERAKENGRLRPCSIHKMQFYRVDETLIDRVSRLMPQLTLEVTESCNARCRYCAYSHDEARLVRPKRMNTTTARNAIELFAKHSRDSTDRCISFWGGEPLLRFPLIRDCVEFATTLFPDGKLRFQFTTNGTLITPEIATFLAGHHISLLVSLDGPKSIHDRNRLNAGGGGTFDAVMRGVEHLRTADPEYFLRCVRFNCVLTAETPLAPVFSFFSTDDRVRGHKVEYSPVVHLGSAPPGFDGLSAAQVLDLDDRLVDATLTGQVVLKNPDDITQLSSRLLQRIARRPRRPLGDAIPPNGCCVPLLKKMHVSTEGEIYTCEKWPHVNGLGNVNDGRLNLTRVLDLVREYATHSLVECRKCWACRLCGACYQQAMRDCRWEPQNRRTVCEARRLGLLASLAQYASIVERSPNAFEHLNHMTFVFPV